MSSISNNVNTSSIYETANSNISISVKDKSKGLESINKSKKNQFIKCDSGKHLSNSEATTADEAKVVVNKKIPLKRKKINNEMKNEVKNIPFLDNEKERNNECCFQCVIF